MPPEVSPRTALSRAAALSARAAEASDYARILLYEELARCWIHVALMASLRARPRQGAAD